MKLNFRNSKKIGVMLGIILFVALAIGVTYATVAWRTTDYNITLNSKCLIQGNFTKSENISGEDLLLVDPSNDSRNEITIKNGMVLSNFSVWKNFSKNCTIDGYLRIALNITNLPNAYKVGGNSTNALRYALFHYDPNDYPSITSSDLNNEVFTTLTKGYIYEDGIKDIYYDTIPNDITGKNYILAIYLDGNLVNNDAGDTTFTASVEASIEQLIGNMPVVEPTPAPNPYTDFTYILGTDTTSVNNFNSAYAQEMGLQSADLIGENEILLLTYNGTFDKVTLPDKYVINNVEYTPVLCPSLSIDSNNYGTFAGNTNITEVYLDSVVKTLSNDYSGMYSGCTSLEIISRNPSGVTNINNSFNGCTSLLSLDLRDIDLSNVPSYSNAFSSVPSSAIITVDDCTQYRLFRTMFGYSYTGLNAIDSNYTCYYQEVEYIQSSGTQWINTDLVANLGTKIIVELAQTTSQTSKNLLGSRNGTSSTGAFGIISFSSTQKIGFFKFGKSAQGIPYDNNFHTYTLSNDYASIDNNTYNIETSSDINNNNLHLILFGFNDNGTIDKQSQIIKSFQAFENNVLVRNFIPCYSLITVVNSKGVQVPSGTIGLYDTVNNVFYTNANTDANAAPFVAGPDVNS